MMQSFEVSGDGPEATEGVRRRGVVPGKVALGTVIFSGVMLYFMDRAQSTLDLVTGGDHAGGIGAYLMGGGYWFLSLMLLVPLLWNLSVMGYLWVTDQPFNSDVVLPASRRVAALSVVSLVVWLGLDWAKAHAFGFDAEAFQAGLEKIGDGHSFGYWIEGFSDLCRGFALTLGGGILVHGLYQFAYYSLPDLMGVEAGIRWLPTVVDRVILEVSAGWGRDLLSIRVARKSLKEEEAAELDRLVFRSGYFKRAPFGPNLSGEAGAGAISRMKLSISAGGKTHTVRWTEANAPGLVEIVRWVKARSDDGFSAMCAEKPAPEGKAVSLS